MGYYDTQLNAVKADNVGYFTFKIYGANSTNFISLDGEQWGLLKPFLLKVLNDKAEKLNADYKELLAKGEK